jgi:hypothetical protein
MKQFASWFTHGVPHGAQLRKAVYEAKNAAEILGSVDQFFDGLLNSTNERIVPPRSQALIEALSS